MSDVFISYKREEQPIARKLADALESEGWTVWWDPKLRAGERFDDVIEKALNEAKCVIVIWSERSVQSRYVRDEATYALERDKLVPVSIENVNLPFRFSGVHTLSLLDWDGSKDFSEFRRLVEDIAAIVGAPAIKRQEAQPAMDRLRDKYLDVPLNAVLHPASSTAQQAAKAHQLAASNAPEVQETALTAQEWFEQGFNATDPDEQLRCYSEAIRLNPNFPEAFYNRGVVRQHKGDLDGALKDLDEAIRLKPDYAPAWGFVRRRWRANFEPGRWRADFVSGQWLADVEQFPTPPSSPLEPKRGWAGVGIGVLLMIVILSGTVLYSRQSGSLAALGVNLEQLVGGSWKNPTQIQAPDNNTQDKKRATSMAR